jgi:hypothetical protein
MLLNIFSLVMSQLSAHTLYGSNSQRISYWPQAYLLTVLFYHMHITCKARGILKLLKQATSNYHYSNSSVYEFSLIRDAQISTFFLSL